MDKKRVLLVNSLRFGGGEKVVALLAEAANIPVLLLNDENDFQLNDEILNKDLCYKQNILLKLFSAARKLKNYVESNSVSIVQSHLINANLINCIAVYFGSPHKAEIVNHGMFTQRNNEGLKGRLLKFLMRLYYRQAYRSIFVSKACKDDYLANIKLMRNPEVIYNPFDVNSIMQKSRETCSVSGDYFIAVGRLEQVKRYDVMFDAYSRYVNNGGLEKLYILGNGILKDILQKRIEQLQLQDRIILLGAVSNPYPYIKNAKALIQASESETFSNTVVEAIILGTRVISTKSGGPNELLAFPDICKSTGPEECLFGYLTDINNPDQIAKAMETDNAVANSSLLIDEVQIDTVLSKYMREI